MTATPAKRHHWPELDLIRGLACALMVVNHTGVRWLVGDNISAFNAGLTFLGSLAPVVFYATTGFGRGVQTGPAPRPWRNILPKVGLLFIADAALWMTPSKHFRMDFLAFIGLSTLVVESITRSKKPRLLATVLIFASLGARYVLGSAALFGGPEAATPAVVGWILGTGAANISYVLSPWITYALLGYLAGRWTTTHAEALSHRAGRFRVGGLLLAFALLGTGACLILRDHGTMFFRWGRMSAGYYAFSITALCFAAFAALTLATTVPSRWLDRLGVAGVASLALVPIHYLLVDWLAPRLSTLNANRLHPLWVLLALCMAFIASRQIGKWAPKAARAFDSQRWLIWTLMLLPLVLKGTLAPERWHLPLMAMTQLLACVIFTQTSRMPTGTPVRTSPTP